MSSLSAQRRLNLASAELSATYERLSSGLRINRASDDAAGLSVASRLLTDRRLYGVAARNINDGISAATIMGGALDQQSSLLGRLAELAEQAANGTLSATQRGTIQTEVDELINEYDRISSTTLFNGISLLRGGEAITIQAGIGGTANSRIAFSSADTRVMSGNIRPRELSDFNGDGSVDAADNALFSDWFDSSGYTQAQLEESFGRSIIFTRTNATGTTDQYDVAVLLFGGPDGSLGAVAAVRAVDGTYSLGDLFQLYHYDGVVTDGTGGAVPDASTGKIGSNNTLVAVGQSNDFDVNLGELTFFSNRPTDSIYNVQVIKQGYARQTLDAVQNMISALSTLRGQLGASESRLASALGLVQNAGVVTAQAAGRILDADIAQESARLVMNQIHQQAAIAVLAQANLSPQLALSLLN